METQMENQENQRKTLVKCALDARKFSYAPYSKFAVGAAVLACERSGQEKKETKDDAKIFTGSNVENASYPAGCCAEHVAIDKAVSEGYTRVLAVAIAGGAAGENPKEYTAPCGICRQVIREFAGNTAELILAKSTEDYEVHTLGELLPRSFGPENLA